MVSISSVNISLKSFQDTVHLAPSLKWKCFGNNIQSAQVQYEWAAVKCQLSCSFDNPKVETSHSWEEGKVCLPKDTIICQRNYTKKKIMSGMNHCHLNSRL